jgi:hypothetical protein
MLMVDAGETTIHVERGGSGPAVLLLHGFPETLAMWREIASVLRTPDHVPGTGALEWDGTNVTGYPVDGGHFFPEEDPQETAEALAAFFSPMGD